MIQEERNVPRAGVKKKKVSKRTRKPSPSKLNKTNRLSFYDHLNTMRLDLTGAVIQETEGGRWIKFRVDEIEVFNLNALRDLDRWR